MKTFSDLEQSKILSEFLPCESADMWWPWYSNLLSDGYYDDFPMFYKPICNPEKSIPCWSLSALLNILAKQEFIIKSSERNNEYQYNIDIPIRHCKIWFSSLLDAAFEMIIWLNENNKL